MKRTTTLALLALLGACAGAPIEDARRSYALGDYAQAEQDLGKGLEADPSNAHVWRLEQGVVQLALGRPRDSIQNLRSARDRLDDLGGTNAAEWLGSVLLDDRQLDYAGYDYEHVLVRALLALADLMGGGTDADAYALQVLERQRQIIGSWEEREGQNPKHRYKLVAFGSYLRAILAEERPTSLDVARRAFAEVAALEPAYPAAQADLERVNGGVHSQRGHGVVYVLGLVGRAPYRVEVNEPVTQAALAIAQWIWAVSRDHATIPNITQVGIPGLAYHRDNPTEVLVRTAGGDAGATATVTDVEQLARVELDAMRDSIVARAVLRRAFKITLTEGAKELVSDKNRRRHDNTADLIDLGISLLGLFWTGLEEADLRCWSLLPAKFQSLRLELPIGDHELELVPAIGGRPSGPARRVQVHVRDGRNTYVVCLAPTLAAVPAALSSESAAAEVSGANP